MHLAEHPTPYLWVARRRYPGPSPKVVGPATELVIDGYTRSATTLAVYPFQLARPRPVHLAHHLHALAQLIEAAKRGIPALALIRDLEGAILSQAIQEPDMPLSVALLAYSRFYERLMPHRSRLVAGPFDELTNDPAAVIARVNERFGTSFGIPDTSEAGRRECLELMRERSTHVEAWSRTLLSWESGDVTREEMRLAQMRYAREASASRDPDAWVPSPRRDEAKTAQRAAWEDPHLADLRQRAEAAYDRFVSPPLALSR